MKANNETVFMSRRYPKLARKVLLRDSKIASKLVAAWDIEKNPEKVLSIFIKEKGNLSNERYWELLRTVWIIAGGLNKIDTFRQLMLSPRPERYYFNTPEDAKKLRDMPELFEVYRAGKQFDNGISWTTSLEYAEWYRKAYNKEDLLTKTVNKVDCFAFIQRNKEDEIIIL
jgi:hypothetical protein